jgi:hypothetical protein
MNLDAVTTSYVPSMQIKSNQSRRKREEKRIKEVVRS